MGVPDRPALPADQELVLAELRENVDACHHVTAFAAGRADGVIEAHFGSPKIKRLIQPTRPMRGGIGSHRLPAGPQGLLLYDLADEHIYPVARHEM